MRGRSRRKRTPGAVVSVQTIALACAATVALANTTTATPCIDYGAHLRVVGRSSPFTASLRDVVASGSFVYVAATDGLHILDAHNETAPILIASLPPAFSSYWAVDVVGSHAVMGDWGGVVIVDVSDPFAPQQRGDFALPGNKYQIVIRDQFAYIGGSEAFHVMDISAPDTPLLLASLEIGSATGIALQDDLAYVTSGKNFFVIDVANPATPMQVSLTVFPNTLRPKAIAVTGDFAYLGEFGRVRRIDVSDPLSPVEVDFVGTTVHGPLREHGGLIFRTHWDVPGYLEVVDFDAEEPVVGRTATRSWCRGMYALDERIYIVGGSDELEIVNAEHPTLPPIVAGLDFPDWVEDVFAAGRWVYTAGSWGVHVLDALDRRNPVIVGNLESSFQARGIDVVGNLAFVAGEAVGLAVVDVSDPSAPIAISTTPGVTSGRDVATAGSFAYVLSSQHPEFYVVDVSDPSAPWIVATEGLSGFRNSLNVLGTRLYVATNSGVFIYALHDPSQPYLLGVIGIGPARAVEWAGPELVFVAAGESVVTVDVSVPSSPVVLASVSTIGHVWDLDSGGDFLYAAEDYAGVRVLDVSNPLAPRDLGVSAPLPYDSRTVNVHLDQGYVWSADYDVGFRVLPSQCEPTPVLLSGFTAVLQGQSVELLWFTSFELAHDGFNLYRSPSLEHGYSRLNTGLIRGRSPYSHLDKAVSPSTTYFYRLGAVDVGGAEKLYDPVSVTTSAWGIRPALAPGAPNPFSKKTTLAFSLPAAQEARVAVYDVAGRLVNTVVDGELPEGDHAAIWDGRDNQGLRVSGGTYFVRLQAGGETVVRKVVFVGD